MTDNTHNSKEILSYRYKFTFSSNEEVEFNVSLDKLSLSLIPAEAQAPPEWTLLRYSQCPNCTLKEEQHRFCPIAVNLVDVIEFFVSRISYEKVDLSVRSDDREYIKHTSLDMGLSSLIGLLMVTSGCPIMQRLKPMAFHHLPFASAEETTFRVISMYILAQYLRYKRGKKPDWELRQLTKLYDDIRIVNKHFCKRISGIGAEDASINALVHLDVFADFVTFSLDGDILNQLELMFSAYLE